MRSSSSWALGLLGHGKQCAKQQVPHMRARVEEARLGGRICRPRGSVRSPAGWLTTGDGGAVNKSAALLRWTVGRWCEPAPPVCCVLPHRIHGSHYSHGQMAAPLWAGAGTATVGGRGGQSRSRVERARAGAEGKWRRTSVARSRCYCTRVLHGAGLFLFLAEWISSSSVTFPYSMATSELA